MRFAYLIIFFMYAGFIWASQGYEISYTELPNGTLELTYELNQYQLQTVEHEGQVYTRINFENGVYTQKAGFAELPIVSAAVQLPPRKNVDAIELAGFFEDIKVDNPLLPSRGVLYRNQNPEDIPYRIDPQSITKTWYPELLSSLSKPYIIRDIRGTTVQFYPFRYQGSTQTLRIYNKFTVRLIENDTDPINPLSGGDRIILPEMDALYKSVFINYTASEEALSYEQYGDILLITTARDESAIQPYIDWKREKGFQVQKEVVAQGTNVKSLIKNQYDANNNILYVQLVGDWQDIQSDLGTSSNLPMDPEMGCVEGDDDFIDIAIGRLSAQSSTEVTLQVDKIITYEKYPQSGADWYHTATGIASDQGPGDDNEYDDEHNDVIWNDKLNPFTYINYNAIYDPTASSLMVTDAVNNGNGVMNYTGHGSSTGWSTSGFSNSDVTNLTNGHKLPFIISVACNNGEFNISSGDCFSEAWLKKDGGGAVLMLGSTISQPWDPPMRGQDYFMDLIIGGYNYDEHTGQNGINTNEQRSFFGSIFINGVSLMLSESATGSDVETAHTWTTFGDPSIQLRTKNYDPLTLSNRTVTEGQNYSTTVSSNGVPVEGAMVSVSQNEQYFSGITDAQGDVTIGHSMTAGTALLVTTAFNTETVYDTIDVGGGDGPYLVVESYQVDDVVTGNNNGQADFNESVTLDVSVENAGNEPAVDVNAVLKTDDAYITITDSLHDYGLIESGQTVLGDDAFALTIAEDAPDQHNALCNVEFSDTSDGKWTSEISILLHAPSLTIGALTIDDQDNGNNDGNLDEGENADLIIPTSNDGHADATETQGVLTTDNTDLSITEDTYNFGTIVCNDTSEAVFNVSVSTDAEPGSEALLYYTVTSGAYVERDTFTVVIGDKQIYVMSDTTVTVRNGLFYDSGGQDNNYANREGVKMTFYPEERTPAVQVQFTMLELEYEADYLHIFDGSDVFAPECAGSPFTGSELPDQITATNAEGALTFMFRSNTSNTLAGWQADIYSTDFVSQVDELKQTVPAQFALKGAYPNPFNPKTTIQYQLSHSRHVQIDIFNALGKHVVSLLDNKIPEGRHRINWEGTDRSDTPLNSGIYFVRMRAGNFEQVQKVIMIK
ncbi:MAG: T9SS type A sorting domain-containing protein [Caldithrix sp.]|nr:T9SS type A sorting domain-containing protein [Caldithrix sp.]